MPSYNKVILMGNLTRDPKLRHLKSGLALCEMGVAINDSYKDKDGNTKEVTTFVDVVAWARQAETCAEYLRKGSPVHIDGRLQFDEWEKDGEKRSKLIMRADRVQFLGAKSAPNGASETGGDSSQGAGHTQSADSGQGNGVDEMPF